MEANQIKTSVSQGSQISVTSFSQNQKVNRAESVAALDTVDRVSVTREPERNSFFDKFEGLMAPVIDKLDWFFMPSRMYEDETPSEVVVKLGKDLLIKTPPVFVGISLLWGALLSNPVLGLPFGAIAVIFQSALIINTSNNQPVLRRP